MAQVVECLVRHAAGHRTVADHRDDVAVVVRAVVSGDGKAVGVAEHRARVAVLDEVVAALLTVGVAGQAVGLAQVGEPGLAAGENFVHVGLVARVPQDRVVRALEHPVQGDGEFHRAQVAAQVPARVGDRIHDELTDLRAEFVQLLRGQPAQVCGGGDPGEQGHSGFHATRGAVSGLGAGLPQLVTFRTLEAIQSAKRIEGSGNAGALLP